MDKVSVYALVVRIFISSVAAGVLFIAAICIQRVWFHPLSRYPGPIWAKVTDFHAAYHSWKGDLHIDMWRCHEKYGDYIRYGPNRLIFNTTEALKDIYTVGDNVQKCKGYLAMMHRVANTITQRDKALHAKQRRLLSHGFSEAALKSYGEAMQEHIEIFCSALRRGGEAASSTTETSTDKDWSEPMNMSTWCDYLTFDITLDIVYGFKSRMLSKPDNRPLLEALEISNVRVGVMIPLNFLKNTFLDIWAFRSAIIARYTFIGFIRKLLSEQEESAKNPGGRKNIYNVLLTANDGEGLSKNEIAAESTNLITAGFETTATAISSFFFYLSRNPDVYAQAVQEVRNHFTPTDTCDRGKLQNCTYLRACIHECLRMSPPVPASPFREVTSEGAIIDSHVLRPGCEIGTAIYSIHHKSEYFPDPHVFKPERWLRDEKDMVGARAAYNPFSVGSRQCIGKGLATLEMMSVLATVLSRFDFKVAEGEVGKLGEGNGEADFGRHRVKEFQLYDHVIAARNGPVLQFRAC